MFTSRHLLFISLITVVLVQFSLGCSKRHRSCKEELCKLVHACATPTGMEDLKKMGKDGKEICEQVHKHIKQNACSCDEKHF